MALQNTAEYWVRIDLKPGPKKHEICQSLLYIKHLKQLYSFKHFLFYTTISKTALKIRLVENMLIAEQVGPLYNPLYNQLYNPLYKLNKCERRRKHYTDSSSYWCWNLTSVLKLSSSFLTTATPLYIKITETHGVTCHKKARNTEQELPGTLTFTDKMASELPVDKERKTCLRGLLVLIGIFFNYLR